MDCIVGLSIDLERKPYEKRKNIISPDKWKESMGRRLIVLSVGP